MEESQWNPLDLTSEQARDIVRDESNRFEVVEENDLGRNGRWSVLIQSVFRDNHTDKHYMVHYNVGATEQQYEEPFEYDKPIVEEVVRQEMIVEKWMPVK